MSFKPYLYTFLLGGVVVPTAVIAFALYYIFTYYSVPYTPEETFRKVSSFLSSDRPAKTSGSTDDILSTGPVAAAEKAPEKQASFPAPKRHVRPLQGWMSVRRDFYGREPTEKSAEHPSSAASAGSGANTSTGATMSTAAARYSTLIKDSYLSFARGSATPAGQPGQDISSSTAPTVPAHAAAKANHPGTTSSGMQEKVFAVLKGKVLFLYSDETKSDCLGALDVEAFSVGISRGDEDEERDTDDQGAPTGSVMREGELFSKRNAIILRSVPRLEDPDLESSPKSRRRARSDALKRSSSVKSSRSATTAVSGMAPSLGTGGKAPTLTRKSTQPCVTELKHMSESDRLKTDGNNKLPATIPSLTKDMDDGSQGVTLPGQDQIADMAADRDKTMLEVEEEEKEKRRKEKQARDKRRSRIEGRPWYLFLRNNVKMEEWYLSLLGVSAPSVPSPSALDDLDERTKRALGKLTARPGVDEIFPKDNMKKLIDKLNTDSDQGNVRWLNGLIGRLFLGICNTVALEAFIIERVMKKINKAKLPGWIEYIRIDEVDVGDVPPTFSQPMLKDLTEDGAYAADVHFNYEGEFRLKVSAAGSFSIRGTNLGRATAQLNVRILSIQGNLRIRINKPPSNRVWWCFTEPPQIVMHVEPILASRKMQLNALTRVIEKQIREGIADACVYPYCDDLPFFDTSNLKPRGGIFDEFSKKRGPNTVAISAEMGAEGLEPKAVPMEKSSSSTGSPARRRSTSLSAAPPSMSAEALANPPLGSTGRHGRSDSDSHFAPGVDRSPTDGGMSSTLAKSLSGGTKKWFANRASGESTVASSPTTFSAHPESSASVPSRNSAEIRDSSPPSLLEGPSTKPAPEELERNKRTAVLSEKETTNAHVVSEPKVASAAIPSSTINPTAFYKTVEESHSIRSLPTDSASAADGTAGSLMDTIRTRAKDKQALQTSVNQAKDAMRKWGTNWAAKRNLPIGTLPKSSEDPPVIPPPVSAPSRQATPTLSTPSHRDPDVRGMEIPRGGLSLQERLAHVTQLATSPDRKPRQSIDSEKPAGEGHLAQLENEKEKLIATPLSMPASEPPSKVPDSNTAISASKDSKRLSGEKPSLTLATASHHVKPDLPPPRLPPRAHPGEDVQRASETALDPAEHVASSPVTSTHEPSLPAPPPLPRRLPTEHAASDSLKLQPPTTNSALPSPSLPRAEEVLKGVMAASHPAGDIK